jgi:hypothetical protein
MRAKGRLFVISAPRSGPEKLQVIVGFFQGASLPDPARLLQGTGRFMRHVKLKPETATNAAALRGLLKAAYSDIKARVEHG